MSPFRYLLFFLIIGSISCSNSSHNESFQPIDFSFEAKINDINPYKLPVEIDSIIEANGGFGGQLGAWEYSYIGAYKKVLELWDGQRGGRKIWGEEEIQAFKNDFSDVDAIQHIISSSSQSEILIINEAHHMPPHRIFTTRLLQGLYDNGYRYLGLETLASVTDVDPDLNTRKYPYVKSGYYSREPQFGQLIRAALQIGYQLFDYEPMGKNGKDREIGQAENVKSFIESRPDDGKVLIHCGFDHAYEGNYPAWEKAMAGRLLEFTGIDPLTINQTTFSEKSTKAYEDPLYQALDIEIPTIFLNSSGDSFNPDSVRPYRCDLYVFHPRTSLIDEKPDWLFYGNRKTLEIEIPTTLSEEESLLLCYVEGEEIEKAVPVEVVLVPQGKNSIKLVVEPGSYQLILLQESGTYSKKLRVKK